MYRCESDCYIGLPWWTVAILMVVMGVSMLLVVVLWPRRYGPGESGRELVREPTGTDIERVADALADFDGTTVDGAEYDYISAAEFILDKLSVRDRRGRHAGPRAPSRWQQWQDKRAQRRAERDAARDVIDTPDDTPMPPSERDDYWESLVEAGIDPGWSDWRPAQAPGSVTDAPETPVATPASAEPDQAPSDQPAETFPQESPRWWLGGKRGRTLHYHTCSVLGRDGVNKTPVPAEYNNDYDTLRAWAERQNLVMCSKCTPLGAAWRRHD